MTATISIMVTAMLTRLPYVSRQEKPFMTLIVSDLKPISSISSPVMRCVLFWNRCPRPQITP
ncbi:MAG: hypothetical protein ACKVE4_04955 [Dissulfuribacterales bacterium]